MTPSHDAALEARSAQSVASYVEVARHLAFGEGLAAANTLAALADDPVTVAETLRAHHVLGLMCRAAADLGGLDPLSPALHAALASRQPVQRLPPEAFLDAFDEIRDVLAAERVPVLHLKGLYFAERLYGGIERRPQFDLDVLVPAKSFRRALALLRARGFTPTDYDLHSHTLLRGSLKVDVHRHLRWAPAYRLDEPTLWSSAISTEIGGRQVRTLSDDHTLLLSILGLFEDLGQGMARLKHLVDLVRLLRELDPAMDWERFLADREREELLSVSVNVLALTLDLFQAHPRFPLLAHQLTRHSPRLRHRDRDHAVALLAGPRKNPANLAWFAGVYPGSIAHYLARFWLGGFPANLRHLRRPWVRDALRLALRHPGTAHD